jgi:hypothetical protein
MAEQDSGRGGVETFEVGGTTFHRVAFAPGAEDEDEIDLAFFGEKGGIFVDEYTMGGL